MNTEVLSKFRSGDELALQAASDLAQRLSFLLQTKKQVNLVLTGGTVGIKTLAALSPHLASLNLSNLHLWWGDERFVGKDNQDRNFIQALEVLISKIEIPKQNLHPMPSSDDGSLDDGARSFQNHIESIKPEFDIVLLGMGPDAHVASLFPGSSPKQYGEWVVAESNSPKAPSQRISLSFDALSGASEVWFLVSGEDKAVAVQKVFSGSDLPATKVSGKNLTLWYLDQAAASLITS
jgi:6-phosphogluconolactonase